MYYAILTNILNGQRNEHPNTMYHLIHNNHEWEIFHNGTAILCGVGCIAVALAVAKVFDIEISAINPT